ncbi:uncharacterized protein LOC136751009 isoform X2 [Amia ocellicauda]|uniref:uncharacterized protein LOC136751009 isoform X2 n=1 Tax=Amia ocellicauda TaxID=2972642 RepID=UPI00346446C1
MATSCQERRVLVEIPAPQPKISAHIRRSYFDALNYRVGPSPYPRNNITNQEQDELVEPSTKKQRLNQKKGVGLELHLMALSQQQLVDLVSSLMFLEEEKNTKVLCPDLKLLQEHLQCKKANVYRSIPYSRLGSNRDAHCYRKAYPHLLAFKQACVEGGKLLLKCKQWDAALEFGLSAWRYTSELPQWDTSSHNMLRAQCFSTLATHCITALQQSCIGMAKCLELKRRFKISWTQCKEITPCIEELERMIDNLQSSTPDSTGF